MQKLPLEFPGNVAICGATMSGKTHLTKRIMREHLLPKFDYIVILSPTVDLSGDWDEFKVTLKNHDPTPGNPTIYKSSKGFRKTISELVEGNTRLKEDKNVPRKEIPNIALILDDMVGNPLLKFNGYIDKLSTKSRHLNISIFILSQRISAVPRTYRLNTKYTILFNAVNMSELERFTEECCPRKYRKLLPSKIPDIYNTPYNFILCHNFATKVSERMYVNGITPIQQYLEV